MPFGSTNFSVHWMSFNCLKVHKPSVANINWKFRLPCRGQIHKTIYHSKARSRTNGDDCLILASDGLWDVISNEDACRAARLHILRWHKKNDGTCFGEGGKPTISESDPASQAAAECLVRLALSRGSEDNITVIVIDLKRRKMHGQR